VGPAAGTLTAWGSGGTPAPHPSVTAAPRTSVIPAKARAVILATAWIHVPPIH